MNRHFVATATLIGFALSGCATNPVTGRPEMVLMSAEREAALGQQAATQVAAEIGLVENEKLSTYVSALGDRLASHSPRRNVRYRFHVADMPEPNAFALPGGYIYVSRGLLALSNNETELANVIGHEIGHVAARHSAQRETRAIGAGVLTAIGTLAAAVVGGGQLAEATSQFGQMASAGLIASYGRDQERQADEVGQGLAARSGWDPAGMSAFLNSLERETALRTGQERLPGFLDSHPATGERVQTTAARASSLERSALPPVAKNRADFLERIRGIMLGPNPEEGVFRDTLFLHPTLDFALRFPPGWRTQNQKQQVAAQAPDRDALLLLEGQGPSGDPSQSAKAWAQANNIALENGEGLRLGTYLAYRARAQAKTQSGDTALEVTWIAHPKGTFRLTALAAADRFPVYAKALRAASDSIRPPSAAERRSIRALRLSVAKARRGERLANFSKRTKNRWSIEETALRNGIDAGGVLRAGQLLKIAVEAEVIGSR